MIVNTFKCTCCGQKCYDSDDIYPTLVFSDAEHKICEDCSIDYEQLEDGTVQFRMI